MWQWSTNVGTTLCRRCLSISSSIAKRVAIVGAGPSGLYTAQYLLKARNDIAIDVFEKYPVPFGLARFGVAPDHPEVKNCTEQFQETLSNNACRYFGNVAVGSDIDLAEIRNRYDAIVLSYGASQDRRLSIPGEDLAGVFSAREFVGWYNGDPLLSNLDLDLSGGNAVIFGVGNVALDVARVLLSFPSRLANTDISSAAYNQLCQNNHIRHVSLVGRRGALEVAFTIKELRELIRLPGVNSHIGLEHVDFSEEERAWIEATRPKRRLLQLIEKTAREPLVDDNATKSWSLELSMSPVEFLEHPEKPGHVGSVKCEIMALEGAPGQRRPHPTSQYKTLPADVAFRSVGFLGESISEDLPFDRKRGVLLNNQGRVQDQPGLYCSGWIKNGPVGIIATTMSDAQSTANVVLADLDALSRTTSDDIQDKLVQQGLNPIDYAGWLRIKEAEVNKGQEAGKPVDKMLTVEEMLAAANAS